MSGRKRLGALRRRAASVQDKTKQVKVEVTEKRAKAKAKAPVVDFKKAVVKVKPINSLDVEQWFRDGIWELYGRKFIIPSWTVKQKTLAKRLLTAYGPELTQSAVAMLCSGWNDMKRKSRGRLSGAPTINLLWGMRERVYADVQNVGVEDDQSPENSDEYREGDGGSDIGW